ncbi:methyltransferase domain-containing protein [Streptomyces sp. NPDC005899]|uniref:methyltransferase domain-containing protein n=1 Tax=Streptomyces sp. NPDC005899 TaxID=3155716 RepID=UPI003409AC12
MWDTEPELASAHDLPRFPEFLGPGTCLLDLGCGNGSRTRHLARHVGRVIGADASAAAVRAASAQDPHTEYPVLDVFDAPAVRALHDRTDPAKSSPPPTIPKCACAAAESGCGGPVSPVRVPPWTMPHGRRGGRGPGKGARSRHDRLHGTGRRCSVR